MRRFSALYDAIDQTTSTNAKVEALAAYFRDAPPADAAWATFFLTGRRLRRVVASAALREWAQELTQLPPWLFGECYAAAGDFAEIPERQRPRGPPQLAAASHARAYRWAMRFVSRREASVLTSLARARSTSPRLSAGSVTLPPTPPQP